MIDSWGNCSLYTRNPYFTSIIINVHPKAYLSFKANLKLMTTWQANLYKMTKTCKHRDTLNAGVTKYKSCLSSDYELHLTKHMSKLVFVP